MFEVSESVSSPIIIKTTLFISLCNRCHFGAYCAMPDATLGRPKRGVYTQHPIGRSFTLLCTASTLNKNRPKKNANSLQGRDVQRIGKNGKKHTTAGVRWSSPTQLLICRSTACLWESRRDPEFSIAYGRMCSEGKQIQIIGIMSTERICEIFV